MWFCRRKRGELESKKRGGRVEKGGMLQAGQPHIARQMEWERIVTMFLVKHCCDVIERQGDSECEESVTP